MKICKKFVHVIFLTSSNSFSLTVKICFSHSLDNVVNLGQKYVSILTRYWVSQTIRAFSRKKNFHCWSNLCIYRYTSVSW